MASAAAVQDSDSSRFVEASSGFAGEEAVSFAAASFAEGASAVEQEPLRCFHSWQARQIQVAALARKERGAPKWTMERCQTNLVRPLLRRRPSDCS